MPPTYSSSFFSPALLLRAWPTCMWECQHPVPPAGADISLHQGHKMIGTPTSCASRPSAWVRTTLYITSDQYPAESNLQSSPVKPTQHTARWVNQPAETTWHYFRIICRESAAARRNLQGYCRRQTPRDSANIPSISPQGWWSYLSKSIPLFSHPGPNVQWILLFIPISSFSFSPWKCLSSKTTRKDVH